MPGGFQVDMDAFSSRRVQWQKPQLAMNAQVLDTAPFLQIGDHQLSRLLAAQAVVQQHGQNRPITLAFERVGISRIEQGLGLVIAEGRCLAFIGFDLGRLTPCTGLPPATALHSSR